MIRRVEKLTIPGHSDLVARRRAGIAIFIGTTIIAPVITDRADAQIQISINGCQGLGDRRVLLSFNLPRARRHSGRGSELE